MPLVGSSVDTIFTVETSPGSGIYSDLSAYLLHGSLTVKLNTVDFALLDPPAGSVLLTDGVKMRNPTWAGTIAAVTTSDPVDLRNNHVVYSCTATNVAALPTDTAPFDLSDVPNVGPAFNYLLEDGSGHYLLEDSTDWAPGAFALENAYGDYLLEDGSGHYLLEDGTGVYLLETGYAKGYSHLSIQTNVVAGAPNKTLGRCQVISPGLRPGNQFALTSLNQGYTLAPFQITQVTARWPALAGNPFFDIEFGDTPQTLAAWSAANIAAPGLAPPPAVVPSGPVIFGTFNVTPGTYDMGAGIVTIGSATFSVSVPSGHTLTCQVVSQFLGHMIAWDNYIATPRRAVRALISGGIFTGAWQEMPFGLTPLSLDLGSAPGIALAAGTYTISIQINTQEFNQMVVSAGWAQVAVTTV